MKSKLINTFRKDDSDYDDYSVFENPDKELKEQIVNFKIDETKVELGWPEKEWTIVKYEKDEVKCKSGKNIQYFPIDEVKEGLKEKRMYELNQKFKPYEYFKKHFGVVSLYHKDKHGISLNRLDLDNGVSLGTLVGVEGEIDPTGIGIYNSFYEYEVETDDNKICLSYSHHGSMLNLYFNEEGNYVNRDYNLDLGGYKCEDVSPESLLSFFDKKIVSLGKLGYANGKYYTTTHCYIPFADVEDGKYGVEKVPVRKDNKSYQRYSGSTIHKKPLKLEKKTGEDLLMDIKKLIPKEIINSFRLEKEQHPLLQE